MSLESVLWENDATALAGLVRKGEISPAELVDTAIARAERTQPQINATAEKLYEAARSRARNVDRSLPLAGVPTALKDLGIAMKRVPNHSGSRMPPFVPDYDSVLTQRLLAAGLIPIVTSTSPELGLRLVTESAAFGVTRNPWDTDHITGGSSGGAAALVAAGVSGRPGDEETLLSLAAQMERLSGWFDRRAPLLRPAPLAGASHNHVEAL